MVLTLKNIIYTIVHGWTYDGHSQTAKGDGWKNMVYVLGAAAVATLSVEEVLVIRNAATVDRLMARAAASALRGAVSAIRSAMAPLAAGGGAVIAVVLVLCLVAALIMSPLGIFFNGEEIGGQTIADAVREINQEYSEKLEELKSGATYDQLSMTGARAPMARGAGGIRSENHLRPDQRAGGGYNDG